MSQQQLLDTTQVSTGADVCLYLVVPAGWVESVGAAGEQCLIVSGHQDFNIVVTLILKHIVKMWQLSLII